MSLGTHSLLGVQSGIGASSPSSGHSHPVKKGRSWGQGLEAPLGRVCWPRKRCWMSLGPLVAAAGQADPA